MRAWLSIFGIGAIGFGIGFFAGERYGRKKKAEENPIDQPSKALSAEEIAKEEGYIFNDEDMYVTSREMDAYLAEFEHPEEDEAEKISKKASNPYEDRKSSFSVCFDPDIWENETEYNQQDLAYYMDDGILCDEDERRIEDVEDLIGQENLDSILDSGMQEGFIRDDWTETLYRVHLVPNSYGRVVLGLTDNDE